MLFVVDATIHDLIANGNVDQAIRLPDVNSQFSFDYGLLDAFHASSPCFINVHTHDYIRDRLKMNVKTTKVTILAGSKHQSKP